MKLKTTRPVHQLRPGTSSVYIVKVCVGFTVGGAIGLLGILAFPLSLITYPLGGALSGASLGMGRRPVIGFGLTFIPLGLVAPLMALGFQGTGSGSLKEWVSVTIAWLFVYGVGGGIAAEASGLGSKIAIIAVGVFGIAGAIAGAAILIAFSAVTVFVGFLIPHALGGALLAVALMYPSRKRKKLGLCLKCGYDLRASTERCPECGEPFASASQPKNP